MKDEFTDTTASGPPQSTLHIIPVCVEVSCPPVSESFVFVFVRVYETVFGRVHLSLCAIWGQSVVVVFFFSYPPHPSVGSPQMAICKTRPSVSPLPRLTGLSCMVAPLPHLSSSFSPLRITCFTSFPYFLASHFHTSCAHARLSPCPYLSLSVILSLAHLLFRVHVIFLLHYLFFLLCPSLLHSHYRLSLALLYLF